MSTTYFPADEETTRVVFFDADREHEVTQAGLSFDAGSVAAESLVAAGVLRTGNRKKNTQDADVSPLEAVVPTPAHHVAVAETGIADPAAAAAAAKSLARDKADPIVQEQAARAAEEGGEV